MMSLAEQFKAAHTTNRALVDALREATHCKYKHCKINSNGIVYEQDTRRYIFSDGSTMVMCRHVAVIEEITVDEYRYREGREK